MINPGFHWNGNDHSDAFDSYMDMHIMSSLDESNDDDIDIDDFEDFGDFD